MAKKQLGKYEVIERLGRGGMAEVYKAYQTSLDRYVAIKLLHPFLADDPEFKDRFEREARNVARLRHPNIVQVYDFEYDNESESYYMVMELIDGQTLKDHLSERGDQLLPIQETLRILRGSTEALAYAHARGMIHRDVKPANLMIDSDGRVVLTDFGIAKIVTGIQFTASGGMVGTPAYMAPEQGLGEAGDERSDLYSLGVILFQMVTGKLPYDADTPLAVILKHLNEPVPSIKDFNPNVPPEVEAIVYKALDKDPELRYQRAEEMLIALNDAAGIQTDPAVLMAFADPDRKFDSTMRRPAGMSNAAAAMSQTANIIIQPPEPPSLTTSTAVNPSRRPASLWLGIAALGIVLALLGATFAANGSFGIFGGRSTETPTQVVVQESKTPVSTPTVTLTATNTATSTRTPTSTFTPSVTLTPTANATQTVAAIQATSGFLTLQALLETKKAELTPTVDLTGTAENCVKEYRPIVDKEPAKDPIRANTDFTREVKIRNTSNCDWLPGMYITYKSGERFNAQRKIVMKNTDPVRPGEDAVFVFVGVTPKKGGLTSGQWEVRLLGDVLMPEPLTITFFVFE